MTRKYTVQVSHLPPWLDIARLLGEADWTVVPEGEGPKRTATAHMDRDQAADLAARLRGIGVGGSRIGCAITPRLKRAAIRAARTVDARRRRQTTPGFERREAKTNARGRIGLTPERLATALGERYAGRSIVDATCGLGGNTIGFARNGCRVNAIESDEETLSIARQNASVYRVTPQIQFHHDDCRSVVSTLGDNEVLFVDPPWGLEWNRESCTLHDLPLLAELFAIVQDSGGFQELCFKVPPSFDPASIPGHSWTEAVFGLETGDYRRIKYLLIGVLRS